MNMPEEFESSLYCPGNVQTVPTKSACSFFWSTPHQARPICFGPFWTSGLRYDFLPPMYKAIWKFRIQPGSEKKFEEIYGPNGTWTQLFRKANGYLGSELLKDLENAFTYFTIDSWQSKFAFDAFKRDHSAAYKELDILCEPMTEQESLIGSTNAVYN